ncbi:MAG TPA: hypothetical protein VHZ97_11330, partial [Pseudonocardiaceae bacterium]|nr:hypothetical protein [Pseudonocardiaceae bacterium]
MNGRADLPPGRSDVRPWRSPLVTTTINQSSNLRGERLMRPISRVAVALLAMTAAGTVAVDPA